MTRSLARTAFTFGISLVLGTALSLPAGTLAALAEDEAPQDPLAAATEELRLIREQEAAELDVLAAAQGEQEAALGDVAAAESDLARRQAALEAPAAAVQKAQAAVDGAANDAAGAQAGVEAAQRELDVAKSAEADKRAAQEKAQQDLTTAQVKVAERSGVRATRASVRAEKEKGKSKAEEMLAKGSYAFFEYEHDNPLSALTGDASAALKAFDEAEAAGSKIKGRTNIGAKGDATSLDNLKASIRYIRECNAIRKKAGCKELLVTHYLMAVAELQLNWSAVEIDHSRKFNVGENLAWGYGTDAYNGAKSDNPFAGWYDEEKALYEKGVTGSAVGHYLNIVDKNGSKYLTCGFAFRDKSSDPYGTSFGQTFSSTATGTAYDVDKYEERLNGYCTHVQNLIDAYNTAVKEEAQAKAELESAQAAQESAEASLEAAKTAVAAAQAKVTECEKALADSKGDAAAKQVALDAAKKELAEAQAALAPLQAAVEAAKEVVTQKQKALSEREDAVKAAKNSVAEVRKKVTAAQKKRYALLPTVNDASVSGFKSKVTYTYGEMEQKLKLTYKKAKLVEGRDFRLAYKKNNAPGTATCVVSGSDPTDDNATYQGKITKKFTIVPKGVKIKKLVRGKGFFKAVWKTQKIETTGYQLRYSVKKNMKGARTLTMAANNYNSFTLNGAQSKKTYYVQMRTYKKVGGKKYCSAWSKTKSVRVA